MTLNRSTSLTEMWKFIDSMMHPNELVPDKSIFTYDQVFPVYSKLCEIEDIFNDFAQINILKKELTSLQH